MAEFSSRLSKTGYGFLISSNIEPDAKIADSSMFNIF
jgi:hypothetical protein